MNIFQISGGLGNQLFQYLQSKNLEIELKIKFVYSNHFYQENILHLDKRSPELQNIEGVEISWYNSDLMDKYYSLTPGMKRRIYYFVNILLFWRKGSFLIVNNKTLKLCWFLRKFFDDIIFVGHWQNEFKRKMHEKFLLEFRPNINQKISSNSIMF